MADTFEYLAALLAIQNANKFRIRAYRNAARPVTTLSTTVLVSPVCYNTGISRPKMTQRILRAMENPNFQFLGHPTGRLSQRRGQFDEPHDR